jgi:hypothetical protein
VFKLFVLITVYLGFPLSAPFNCSGGVSPADWVLSQHLITSYVSCINVETAAQYVIVITVHPQKLVVPEHVAAATAVDELIQVHPGAQFAPVTHH